jgi:hypothetical protein
MMPVFIDFLKGPGQSGPERKRCAPENLYDDTGRGKEEQRSGNGKTGFSNWDTSDL